MATDTFPRHDADALAYAFLGRIFFAAWVLGMQLRSWRHAMRTSRSGVEA